MSSAARLPISHQAEERVPRQLQAQGLCVGHPDPEVFFRETAEDQAKAKALCAQCPALAACHTYSMRNEAYGVWGNTTADERKAAAGLSIITPEERREIDQIKAAILSGLTVAEVARRLNICERTVYRYRAKMRKSGELVA